MVIMKGRVWEIGKEQKWEQEMEMMMETTSAKQMASQKDSKSDELWVAKSVAKNYLKISPYK